MSAANFCFVPTVRAQANTCIVFRIQLWCFPFFPFVNGRRIHSIATEMHVNSKSVWDLFFGCIYDISRMLHTKKDNRYDWNDGNMYCLRYFISNHCSKVVAVCVFVHACAKIVRFEIIWDAGRRVKGSTRIQRSGRRMRFEMIALEDDRFPIPHLASMRVCRPICSHNREDAETCRVCVDHPLSCISNIPCLNHQIDVVNRACLVIWQQAGLLQWLHRKWRTLYDNRTYSYVPLSPVLSLILTPMRHPAYACRS